MIEITIPILNEEKVLRKQIDILLAFIDNNLSDLGEIGLVLADNGSTDATQEISRILAANSSRIRYLRLEEKGVGRALKASWESSNAEIVGYMDLDLATDLSHIRPAIECLAHNQADIVSGSRLAKGATVIGRSLLRTFTSRCFNLMLKLLFGTKISDGMCGFKFLKRKFLGSIRESGANSNGWFFATEVLLVGEHIGLRVASLPVKWTDDPDSKVKIVSLSLEYLKQMWSLRRRFNSKSDHGVHARDS